MSKQISRIAMALALVASLLFFSASPAAAHSPSCGDHPNRNKGFAINSRQSLTGAQVGNARVIMGIAQERRLPRQAAEVAITAALQASSLRNSPGNDRGLFQQKPQYYPGVAISSPRSATNAFYDRLVTIRGWKTKPTATTARAVQAARATRPFTTSAPIAKALTDRWWGNQNNPTQCPAGTSSSSSSSSNSNSSSNSSSSNSSSSNSNSSSNSSSSNSSSSNSAASSSENKAQTTAKQTTTTRRATTTTKPTAKKKTTTTQKRTTTTKKKVATPPPIYKVSGTNRVRVSGIVVNQSIGTNLQGLITAANKDGINLRGTGWRNPTRQVELRKQNCGRSTYAIYQKPASLCKPPTAKPGRSNHEKGLAVDFRNCGTRQTACYKWLKANSTKYGLRNLPSEPWHWSVDGR